MVFPWFSYGFPIEHGGFLGFHHSFTIAPPIVLGPASKRGRPRSSRAKDSGTAPGSVVTVPRGGLWVWDLYRNHGKTMGKPWENQRKTIGKPWENHMGKPWEDLTQMLHVWNIY